MKCNKKHYTNPLELLILVMDLFIVSWLYNQSDITISIAFLISIVSVLLATIHFLLKNRHAPMQAFKLFIHSKIIHGGALLALTGIFLFGLIPDYHKIISYILFGIGELTLMSGLYVSYLMKKQ